MFGLDEDMRPAMRAAAAAAEPMALVTLVGLSGGGPRQVGAQMLFTGSGASGFLSGGCVEGDIALHAGQVLADGAPRRLVYGDGSPWPDIRLLCGARMDVLVERVAPDDVALRGLLAESDARRPALWVTDGARRHLELAPDAGSPELAVREAPFELRRLYTPVPRLIVFGADPIALAIASLGAETGIETTLVRPNGPQTPPPLAGVAYLRCGPAEALAALTPDAWTSIAVVNHDWDKDEEALVCALPSAASYVGVLGARRRLPERLARLRALGMNERLLARLRGPIGLDLGGKAPWQVAVSVIAEIIAERRGPSSLAAAASG